MQRENKACDGCKDCRLIHGKGVISFFKVMIDKSFLKVLHFPPKFARSVSHLTDQKTYLEDSSGRRWRVRVCKHGGSLAIKQGWPEFSSEHGLKVGEFLVFHYVQDKHFIVQIFGTSACEKIKFCSDVGKGRKRARTYLEATNPVELLQTTAIDSVKKKSRLSAALESEKATYKPNIVNFAVNVDTVTEKGWSVHSAIHVDESFCVIDKNTQYDQEDDRLCLHLSSFEMPASKPVEEGISSPLKGNNGNDNHVDTNSRSKTEPNLNLENKKLNSEALLSQLEAGIKATNMVSRPAEDVPPLAEDIPPLGPKYKNSYEVSQFPREPRVIKKELEEAREARVIKKELEDIATEAFSPARAIHGGEYANGNQKVIKCEPADSRDAPSLNAVNYSCLLEIDGRDFLELPESWRKHLLKKAKQGRMIIFLRGPDKRIWPVFYHSRSRFNVLTCGWKQVAAAYGLNPGNECLFQLVDQRECIFDVRKI
ncbi:hypothetical protein T459_09288 [Capsicum annuum]|uniref:TF-B3 domain-containing protein n=1 Tax=Capsicum annuum TaxID=4072 RepID=A0A2G2ZYX7_CAPAN|nr:uncharacterized protein LOC107863290 isoform X1 [Capsicum annuum]XP_047265295.1 uncharacterized protein LOC107863290 isoform X1 [Capsicum annuum]XP_047265296.1 uncharacterized protein LOC107863290 isoform X1 [Capsicum annuum]PHT87182.1 hypothetical protein T459_09288 [Capsicum annuum]